MVFAEPAGAGSLGALPADSAEIGASPWRIGAPHERLAARLLGAAGALPYFQALQGEMTGEFTGTPAPETAAAMVQRFTEYSAEQVQQLFYVVRRALLAVPPGSRDHGVRHVAEEAAAALYCLAACPLVDEAVRAARRAAAGADKYVMHVPSNERLICAIIATAVFGGELRLNPAEQPGLPAPEYVFEVKVPASGDQIATAFERAAFAAVFPNDDASTEISLDSGPLNPAQQRQVAASFRTIRHVNRSSLALVVHGLTRAEVVQGYERVPEVPVLLPERPPPCSAWTPARSWPRSASSGPSSK